MCISVQKPASFMKMRPKAKPLGPYTEQVLTVLASGVITAPVYFDFPKDVRGEQSSLTVHCPNLSTAWDIIQYIFGDMSLDVLTGHYVPTMFFKYGAFEQQLSGPYVVKDSHALTVNFPYEAIIFQYALDF